MKSLLFDLDYTLYDMNAVLDEALSGVTKELSKASNLNLKEVKDVLATLIERYGRLDETLFNKLIDKLGLNEKECLKICIEAFHSYFPSHLSLYEGVEDMLSLLINRKYRLLLITDGRQSTQRKKVIALNLENYFEEVIYTDDLKLSKPEAFNVVIKKFDLVPTECIMIGDHPYKDIYGAKKVGMMAVRVKRGEFMELPDLNDFEADYTISETRQLLNYLR